MADTRWCSSMRFDKHAIRHLFVAEFQRHRVLGMNQTLLLVESFFLYPSLPNRFSSINQSATSTNTEFQSSGHGLITTPWIFNAVGFVSDL